MVVYLDVNMVPMQAVGEKKRDAGLKMFPIIAPYNTGTMKELRLLAARVRDAVHNNSSWLGGSCASDVNDDARVRGCELVEKNAARCTFPSPHPYPHPYPNVAIYAAVKAEVDALGW